VQRRRTIREELEAELAERHIEAAVRARDRIGAALAPLDRQTWRGDGAGHRQHARADVDADDRAAPADRLGRHPRDDAGAARDVQHAVAGSQRGVADQRGGERRSDCGDEVPLVALGWRTWAGHHELLHERFDTS
jgi:hypothetical protein